MIPDDRIERLEYFNEKAASDEELTEEEVEILVEDLQMWANAMEQMVESLSETMSENMDILVQLKDD